MNIPGVSGGAGVLRNEFIDWISGISSRGVGMSYISRGSKVGSTSESSAPDSIDTKMERNLSSLGFH